MRHQLNDPLRVRLFAAIAVMAACVGGHWILAAQLSHLRGGQSAELTRPLSEFPDRLKFWSGADIPPDDQLQEILKKIRSDGYLQRIYVHPTGERLILWMNYSTRSTDQFHYPTVCMAAGGWEEDEPARAQVVAESALISPGIEAGAMSRMPMMRMQFHRRDARQTVYYWYYLMGEDKMDRVLRRLSQSSRAFLRGRRNTSLTVEIFSQSPNPDERLLDEFAKEVAVALIDWMPPGTETDCALGATY